MELRKISIEEYTVFFEKAKEWAPAFNSPDWVLLYSNPLILGFFDKDNHLFGACFLGEKTRFGFKMLRTLPFIPNNGLIYFNNSKNKANALSFDKKLISAFEKYISNSNYKLVSIGFPFNVIDMQPFIWSGFKVIPNYTYHINLTEQEDVIYKNMAPERRNDINRAIKDGLEVRKENDMKIVERIVAKTFVRKQKSFDENMLSSILNKFANNSNSFAFVTYNHGQPIAASFCIHNNDTAHYILGGYDDTQKHHGAGALALWNAIQYARQLGLKTFDFEGSMLPEVETYFRGFGGQIIPYYRVNKTWMPLEFILKFIK